MTEFHGYERPDGSVGVRNHLLVLAPMDCSIEPARKIAARVEGAVAVTQHHGCRNDPMVANALIGSGRNPNVAGVLPEPIRALATIGSFLHPWCWVTATAPSTWAAIFLAGSMLQSMGARTRRWFRTPTEPSDRS